MLELLLVYLSLTEELSLIEIILQNISPILTSKGELRVKTTFYK